MFDGFGYTELVLASAAEITSQQWATNQAWSEHRDFVTTEKKSREKRSGRVQSFIRDAGEIKLKSDAVNLRRLLTLACV